SSYTAHGLDPLLQPSRLRIPLSRPCAGELDHIIATVRKIQADAHRRQQMKRLTSAVDKPGASGYDPARGKDRIVQFQFQSGYLVGKFDDQRFRLFLLFHIRRGKSGKPGFARSDLVSAEAEF